MKSVNILFILLLFGLLLNSCTKGTKQTSSSSTKDSILNDFFMLVDTLPYYDTNNTDYKFLKAYKQNDTLKLRFLINYIDIRKVKPWINSYLEPCALNTKFDTIKADEAYQFSYSSSFCPYYTVATIINLGNTAKITAIVYKNADIMDSIPCTIYEHKETILDSASWVNFKEEIIGSDFWGFKEDNGIHGVDGSSLDVLGYKKNFQGIGEKRNYVTRWSPAYHPLTSCYISLLKLCKIKSGCLTPG